MLITYATDYRLSPKILSFEQIAIVLVKVRFA